MPRKGTPSMNNTTLRIGPRAGAVLGLLTALLLTGGTPAPPRQPLPVLNEKVVAFARAKRGTSVGDGSCTTLAVAALKEAGARFYPMAQSGDDFTWGEPIESFKEALPGDVLQFR